MAKVIAASSADVREFYIANPKKVPAGDKTVGKPVAEHRGRLSAPAIETFEQETGKTYVPATQGGPRKDSVELTYEYTQPSGRKAKKTETLPMKEVRTLAGPAANSRGRLTAAAMEAAATAAGERETALSAERAATKKAPKAAKVADQPQVEVPAEA